MNKYGKSEPFCFLPHTRAFPIEFDVRHEFVIYGLHYTEVFLSISNLLRVLRLLFSLCAFFQSSEYL